MPWFRVDDKLGEHPKVKAIPRGRRRNAMGLWILAGSWCALNTKQDGNVPGYMIEELCAEQADALELARVGLWHAGGHDCDQCSATRDPDGFMFHDWASLQPTHAEVEAKKAEATERQRRHRERKRAEEEAKTRHAPVTRDTPSCHALSQPPDPTRPDPTRPVSVVTQGGHRNETLRASNATTPPEDARCNDHTGHTSPPACRGCMAARQHAELAATRARDAAARTRQDCRLCLGSGWIERADGSPGEKCDHTPRLEVVHG